MSVRLKHGLALAIVAIVGFAAGQAAKIASARRGFVSRGDVTSGKRPTIYRKVAIREEAPSVGPANAKVTIVEWSDFQCPYCAKAAATIRQVLEAYPNDVRLVLRHQPLSFHEHAQLAAEASMAAHEQGRFWEFHDRLFSNPAALTRRELEEHAAALGLDAGRFARALDERKFRAYVEQDAREGLAIGAKGAPVFFINGRELVGASPFTEFKKIVDEELARANELLDKGTPSSELYARLLDTVPTVAQPASAAAALSGLETVPLALSDAPTKGPLGATVTVVAYSDFECPACRKAAPILLELERRYEGKVRIAFKHLPLPMHPHALLAAQAAMAAHEQGRFWDYHDVLFAHQKQLERVALVRYAAELGLDTAQFTSALDSGKYAAHVARDENEAAAIGAYGTPTFVINGHVLVGAHPLETFAERIDKELASRRKEQSRAD